MKPGFICLEQREKKEVRKNQREYKSNKTPDSSVKFFWELILNVEQLNTVIITQCKFSFL